MILNTEFRRNGQMAGIGDRQLVTIAGPAPAGPAGQFRLGRGPGRGVPGLTFGPVGASRVPYGETTTYGDLARQLGPGTDPRDVGSAVGRNPMCIVIPCHRVIGSTGKLTGYAGGLDRKRALLEIERALPPNGSC